MPQPQVIYNFDKEMGGVDHHDWLVVKHVCLNKGQKKVLAFIHKNGRNNSCEYVDYLPNFRWSDERFVFLMSI